jgi:hypothetical protein
MQAMAFSWGQLPLVGRFGLLLLLPVLAGCGDRNKVSGQVKYDGKPVPGGMVTFFPTAPGERAVTAELDEEGNYEVVLPAGEVKISVDNRGLEETPGTGGGGVSLNVPITPDVKKHLGNPKQGRPQPNRPPGKYRKIPDKYYLIETSGVTYTVEHGDQKHDIELPK